MPSSESVLLNSGLERRILRALKIVDPVVVFGLWWLTFQIWVRLLHKQTGLEMTFGASGALLALIVMYTSAREGLYRPNRLQGLGAMMLSLVRAYLWAMILFVVILYFFAGERISRGVILIDAAATMLVATLIRLSAQALLRRVRLRGQDLFRVLLVGPSQATIEYARIWKRKPETGVHFVGWIDDRGHAATFGIPAFDGDLVEAKELFKPENIVIGYPAAEGERIESLLREHHNDVVPIQILPEISYSVLGMKVEIMSSLPVLTLNQPTYPALDLFLKRAIDIFGALVGLTLLSWLYALLAVLVKLTSPGPVFFGQVRLGVDGAHFKMWKFRSMKVSAESESTWTSANDPRRTWFGSFIRKTSLDELPQLWNVLIGEMSLVGPRPEQPVHVARLRNEIPAYMLRHKMKAGLTGWAQVNGWRGDTDLRKRIECDLFYIRHWSLWLDVKILFLTLFHGFFNRNAY